MVEQSKVSFCLYTAESSLFHTLATFVGTPLGNSENQGVILGMQWKGRSAGEPIPLASVDGAPWGSPKPMTGLFPQQMDGEPSRGH